MRKLLIAVSFAALAFAGIGMSMGLAQTGLQVADLRYDFPTNAEEEDVNIRVIADSADDQRPAPNRPAPIRGDDGPHMRLYSA